MAGKWWGPKNVRPILALHGWQDNAGTFDRLIPLLPRHIGYLALDLPGHGFSSRIPDGLFYSSAHVIHVMHLVQEHYKWKQMSLMAHSMGSIMSYLYASLFPEKCDLLIGLDALKPHHHTSNEKILNRLRKLGDDFFLADLRNRRQLEPPSYTFDEIIERWVKGTYSSITKETAPYLMKRAIQVSQSDPQKYFFTRDSRLKVFNFAMIPHEFNLELARQITAPHLFIKARHSPYYEKVQYFDDVMEILIQKENFDYLLVDGTHHVHLTEPEKVSARISEFILKYRSA